MIAAFARRAAIAAAAAFLLMPAQSSAQITGELGGIPQGNDNVQAFFAADASSVELSDPANLAPWGGPAGIGPYPGLAVPSTPPPMAAPIYGTKLPSSNSFYSAVYGYTSNFTDGGFPATSAVSTIWASPPGGTSIVSANVGVNFALYEPNNPPGGYAYEQLDFVADYTTYGPLAGGVDGAPDMLINAEIESYAQFAGVVEYWWHPTLVTNPFVLTNNTPWVGLGSLDYSWSEGADYDSQIPTLVSPTGIITPVPPGYGNGILELAGDFFVAGDPSQISVQTVPEPSSWLLLAVGAAALGMIALVHRGGCPFGAVAPDRSRP